MLAGLLVAAACVGRGEGLTEAPPSLVGFRLRVLPSTLDNFYLKTLGMELVHNASTPANGAASPSAKTAASPPSPPRYALPSQQPGQVFEFEEALTATSTPQPLDSCTHCPCYWLCGFLVDDAVNAAEALRTAPGTSGYYVSPAADITQFLDVGTMAELVDDSGMQTELLQRGFGPAPLVKPPPPGQFSTTTAQGLAFRTADRDSTLAFWTKALGFKLLLDQRVEQYGFGLLFLVSGDTRFSLTAFDFPGPTHGPRNAQGNYTGNGDAVSLHVLKQPFMQIQAQYYFGVGNGTTVADYAAPATGEAGFLGVLLQSQDLPGLIARAQRLNAAYVQRGTLVEPNGIPLIFE